MIIIGESALYGKKGHYIFESIKNFLFKNNFIKKEWNALNILNQQASRVGAIDLGIYSVNEKENFTFFNKLDNDEFKFLDKGAEIADLILPGAAYTEKDGMFVNLEGNLQYAYKASYPPGDSFEDWIILKDLANILKRPLDYNNHKQLREIIKNHINLKSKDNFKEVSTVNFIED